MLTMDPFASTVWIVIVRSLVESEPPRSDPGMTIVSVAEYPVPAFCGKTF